MVSDARTQTDDEAGAAHFATTGIAADAQEEEEQVRAGHVGLGLGLGGVNFFHFLQAHDDTTNALLKLLRL